MERALSRQRRRAGLLMAILALAAAACGADADSGASETVAPSVPDGASGEPIKVGVLVDATGQAPSGQENTVPVLEAWSADVNDAGGIDGRPVELVIEDTKGDAPTGTAAAERLAADDSVVAVVMFDHSTEGLVADLLTEADLPVVGGMGYAPNAWGALPNWFPLTTSIPSIFNMGMVLGDALNATRTTLTICSEVAGCADAGTVAEAASTALGMTYTGTRPISAAAPDYTAECLQILDDEVDYVMLGAATATAALRLAADCSTQGYEGDWGLFGGAVVPRDMLANDPGIRLELAINAFPWFADDEPVVAYRDLMERQGVSDDAWADPHSTAAYATMELFRVALADAASVEGPVTRRDVIESYGQISGEDLDGLLPQPVTFTADEPQPLITCYWFASFESGVFDGGTLEPVCDPETLAP